MNLESSRKSSSTKENLWQTAFCCGALPQGATLSKIHTTRKLHCQRASLPKRSTLPVSHHTSERHRQRDPRFQRPALTLPHYQSHYQLLCSLQQVARRPCRTFPTRRFHAKPYGDLRNGFNCKFSAKVCIECVLCVTFARSRKVYRRTSFMLVKKFLSLDFDDR